MQYAERDRGGDDRESARGHQSNQRKPRPRVNPLPRTPSPPRRQDHRNPRRTACQPSGSDRPRRLQYDERQRDLRDPERKVRGRTSGQQYDGVPASTHTVDPHRDSRPQVAGMS
ncbi:hypothetical protein GCM10028799_34710 [Kribbella italica]